MNKSIKNQYISLKEGKITEAQFMRNVRMSLPQYISNTTLFKQAERILINKGIISEIKSFNEIGMFNDPIGYRKSEPNPKDQIFTKEYKGDGIYVIYKNGEEVKTIEGEGNANAWMNDEMRKLKENSSVDKKTGIDKEYNYFAVEKSSDKIINGWEYKNLDKESILEYSHMDMKDMDYKKSEYKIVSLKYFKDKNINPFDSNNWKKISESLNEAQDSSATGYYNQNGKEQYGKFDELDNMNAQEIMAGYVLEKIDNFDLDKKEICKLIIKNLKKDPFYYTNYKLTGIPGGQPVEFTSTKRKNGFDQMEELDKKSTNLKDEKNKTQVVKEGLEENETATIGNPAFGGKTSKIKVGDKAILGNEEVTITNIDSKKTGSNTTVDRIYAVTKDGRKVYSQPMNFKPLGESLDEASKTRLKSLVRKMMEEIFDGRDNMTDVTGENN